MSHDTAVTWLKAASGFVVLAGLGFAIAGMLGNSGLLTWFLDLAFFPLDGAQKAEDPEVHLLTAIAGGLTAGLGIMQWLITTEVYAENPQAGRKILLAGIVGWYLVDSTGSVLTGAPFNAVLNLLFLLPFAVPLLAARPLAAGSTV